MDSDERFLPNGACWRPLGKRVGFTLSRVRISRPPLKKPGVTSPNGASGSILLRGRVFFVVLLHGNEGFSGSRGEGRRLGGRSRVCVGTHRLGM